MGNNPELQSTTVSGGIEKRVFERHSTSLDAKVKTPDGNSINCVIRSFCIGGLYITFEGWQAYIGTHANSTQGPETVEIFCVLPGSSNHDPLKFMAKVVRNDGRSMGLSFVNPDPGSLMQLQAAAKKHQKTERGEDDSRETAQKGEQATDNTQNTGVDGERNEELVRQCNIQFKNKLTGLMDRFFDQINDDLFTAARDETNAAKQGKYFEAKEKLFFVRDKVVVCFRDTVSEIVDEYSPDKPLQTANESAADTGGEITLSLVEDDVFDEWLADTVAIENIETHYRSKMIDLDKRLSVIWGSLINKDNNVFGPYVLSNSFQKAIKQQGLDHQINIKCYKVFENILLKELGKFYDSINDFLVEQKILPVINYSVQVNKSKPAPVVAAKPGPVPEPDGPAEQHETSVAPPSTPSLSPSKPAQVPVAGHMSQAGAEQQASQTIARQNEKIQDLYDLVGDLRNLQQQNSQRGPGSYGMGARASGQTGAGGVSGAGTNSGVKTGQAIAYVSQDDLTGALTRLQGSTGTPVSIEENPEAFKERVLGLLGENSTDGKTMQIAGRESRIIDVAGNIFHSLLSDMHVANSMRVWLRQLELPVLRMAINDDTLFLDRSHHVRQVINKIAELDVLAKEGGAADKLMVKKAIEWLVNLISTQFDQSADVFDRAVRQLDLLLDIQHKTYDGNVVKVISSSELEEKMLLEKPVPAEIELKEQQQDEEGWNSWLKKAKRLKEGAWILFSNKEAGEEKAENDGENSRRLRLAWIAPHTDRYVFVNVSGNKDRVLHLHDLVRQLHDETATLLENADEPAMDRAQYSMLENLHQKLHHQSMHDQLTGLINRREFETQLDKALTQVKRSDTRYALFFIDLDQFQVINNTCGYDGGDKLLTDVAGLIRKSAGPDSVLARIGSDEFALLLEGCGLEDALDKAEQQVRALAENRFEWEGKSQSISISVGLVPVTKTWENTSDLLQAAESSCGLAKELGGNRLQLYHAGHSKLSHRDKIIKWITAIESALDNDGLELRCQKITPIQNDSGLKSHYEVLLVVRDSEGEEISVQEFIEAAEWHNRVSEIDRWVIRKALGWMSNNPMFMDEVEGMSINLSGLSLNDETLIEFIEQEIRQSGVPAHQVCFEITETAGVSNFSDAAEFIECVRETGCKFSLDDFGSGMSSYAYLKNLPIDYLKIDGAFVKDIVDNSNDYAVVKSICEIGHFMGKKIVAECVESDECLQQLKNIGVDYAQGYFIERPVAINDLY